MVARDRVQNGVVVLTDGARPLVANVLVWGGKSLLLECVRVLEKLGRCNEAGPFRDRLSELARTSVPARAFPLSI